MPWIWKKGPNCVHLWVESSILNVLLIVPRRKSSKLFPCGTFFLVFLTKRLSKYPNSEKLLLHWKVSGCAPKPCYCIFTTLCNSCILRTLPYSEFWHIQNLRYIQNSLKAYSGIFRTLCNFRILRTLPYSEFSHKHFPMFRTRGIFRILFWLAHSDIFRHAVFDDSCNNIFFFSL